MPTPAGDVAVTAPEASAPSADEAAIADHPLEANPLEEPDAHQLTVDELRADPRFGPIVSLFPDILVELATGGAVLSLPNQPVNYPPSEAAALRRTLKDKVLPALESTRLASKALRDQFGTPSFLPPPPNGDNMLGSASGYLNNPVGVSESLRRVVRHDWEIASDAGTDISPSLWKQLNSLPAESTSQTRSPFSVVDANGIIRQPADWWDPTPLLSQVRESSQTATLTYGELFAVCHLLKAAGEHIAVDRALIATVTALVNDLSPEGRVSTITFLGMNFLATDERQWDMNFRESFTNYRGNTPGFVNDVASLATERTDRLAQLFRAWDTRAESAQRSLHAAWASMQDLLIAGNAPQGLTLAPLATPLPLVPALAIDGFAQDRLVAHPKDSGDGNGPLRNNTLLPVATRTISPPDTHGFPSDYRGFYLAAGRLSDTVSLELSLRIDDVRRGGLARATSDRRLYLGGKNEYGSSPDYPTILLDIDVVSGTLRAHNASTAAKYYRSERVLHNIEGGATLEIPIIGFFEGATLSLYQASPELLKSLENPTVLTSMVSEPLTSGTLGLKLTDERLPDVAYLLGDARSLLLEGTVTPEGRLRSDSFDLRPSVSSP